MRASPYQGLIVPQLDTSAILNIACDIIALEKGVYSPAPGPALAPPLKDWSKTLVAFPGIFAQSEAGPFLEPLFWISGDLRWAVTIKGPVELGRQICDPDR